MDINYFYSRHQVSLMHADAALSPEARAAHLGLARLYAKQINDHRRERPAGARAYIL